MTTLSSYLTVVNNMSRWQNLTAQSPEVKLATQYFENNIGNVKTPEDFIKNPRLFNYAMTAFGLGDMTYAKGLMTKVLDQGVTDTHALANTLSNTNIKAFAAAFDFADQGASTTSSNSLVTNVVNKYIENSLETSQGQQDPGVQLALYFQQKAPSVSNVYSILADKNLLTVVQYALGISPLTAAEPVDTQANMLTSRLNLSDFQDPKKLESFIERFAANYDANSGSSVFGASSGAAGASSTLTVASLFQGIGTASGISPNTLLNVAALKAGIL